MSLFIFDCDGTLVDSEVIATKVFTTYWATHGIAMTNDEFKTRFIGKGSSHPDNILIFSQMPHYAEEEGDRLLEEALQTELQAVIGMFDMLSGLSRTLCVGSNSRLNYVNAALKRTGLDKFFGNRVFSAHDVSHPKPAPDLFLHISKILGVIARDCVVIEDSPSGVKAAQVAGMRVIGFSGAAHFVPVLEKRLRETEPDWFCTSTDELGRLLKQLESEDPLRMPGLL